MYSDRLIERAIELERSWWRLRAVNCDNWRSEISRDGMFEGLVDDEGVEHSR